MKRLGLALAALLLLVPPASPMPLVALCTVPEDCCPEDCCKMNCGADSEPVGTTRSSQAPSFAAAGKAMSFHAALVTAVIAFEVARPIDAPNLPAGLRPPLRN